MTLARVKNIEEELVRKIACGDEKAYRDLFHLYYRRLCRFAFLILQSQELSEEAVADVFFNVWMKRDRLRSERNIRSFLYTSVRNQTINYIQRMNPQQPMENINVYELEIAAAEPLVDETMDNELFRQRLQHAFDELPERCRMIARLHFSDQLPSKEIAKILAIAPKTVNAQIAIATQKIKALFEKHRWNK
jgi:RNA polymerase sigma-70 factor (ECF subfamily)